MMMLAPLALFLAAAATQPPPIRGPAVDTGPEEPWRPGSARSLLFRCTDGRDDFDGCDAYISAIGDALAARSGRPLLCPPRLRALALTRRAVVRSLEDPANRDLPAAVIVERALLATYPCPPAAD